MQKLIGKNINLRLVEIDDAEFILNLRLEKGKFLSNTNPRLEEQKKWIKLYKERESLKQEYYFIIENKDSLPIGTVRIYEIDYKNRAFTFGSFIINRQFAHKLSAFESMNLILRFSFEGLLLENCLFDCRKNNIHANNFYLRFGAKIIREDDLDYFFNFSVDDYNLSKIKYKKFLIQNENDSIS